jgi:ribonuclease R
MNMNKLKGRKIKGILSKHRKGFGFVIPEDKEETGGFDVFIPPDEIRSAMDKDQVSVTIMSSEKDGKRLEGRIDNILTRSATEVVGTFSAMRGAGYVVPESSRLMEEVMIQKKDFNGAKNGDKVVAKITKWPSRGHRTEGRVIEILSKQGEALGDIKALIRTFQLNESFPQKIEKEAEYAALPVTEEEVKNRKDYRRKIVLTIDGADSKDLDDAISIEQMENGNFRLGVHIADVSHYIKEGGALDREAMNRGTSVYLLDIVLPMLPKVLSNGICSLHPGADRLTLSVSMEITQKGVVVDHEIFESVIRSTERLVYSEVSDLLEHETPALAEKYARVHKELKMMRDLAGILRSRRQERGSLDFDFDEAHIILDQGGIPVSVETSERRVANRMIEEFMLIANETVAEHYFHLGLPFVYRIHERPTPEKIDAFKRFLSTLGLRLKGSTENVHPKALNEVLAQVEGTEIEHVVNTVMLRSMKKAFYDTVCKGHFGLGVTYYCHFTSPIRRYPDLIIHRVIKESLGHPMGESRRKALESKTKEAADIASVTERKAEELEREVEKLKKAEYMSYRLGEEFDGIISGIASFGFFAEIPNTIEGLVRVQSLTDDEYIYEQELYRLYGKKTRKTYTLGDKVRVRAAAVDIAKREIDFDLI